MVIAQLHVSSRVINVLWGVAHSILPDVIGMLRPVDVSSLFEATGLRVLRDEVIDETVGTRVTTLMKVRTSVA